MISTGRSSIDGEWMSIILKFSTRTEYRLRPLFFAYENQQQITKLFVEISSRLAMTLSVTYQNQNIQPSSLREKIDALMTDIDTKNLSIEDAISTLLKSGYKTYHLLCKSHRVEAIDRSSLEVLSQIKKSVNQQDVLEKINPALKSFFRGKKHYLRQMLKHYLPLLSMITLQRRFTKLGKTALSILDAEGILQKLVDEVERKNQLLVEAWKIYLSSELFITELECLAYFSHLITFPFLNCVEISSQAKLLVILP